jgi:hypothetical protein
MAMASVSWISPPTPRLHLLELVEDLRREDVAAHHGQVRRGRRRLRLLDEVEDLHEVVGDALGLHAAVAA